MYPPFHLIPDHQCLQVREVGYRGLGLKQSPSGEWRPLDEAVQGFEFVAGERKILRLTKFKRSQGRVGGPSIACVLYTVVESEVATAN